MVVAGLVLLAWPVITDWYFAWEAEQSISEIVSVYDDMSDPERLENVEQAHGWNAHLRGEDPGFALWEYKWQLTYKSTPKSMMAWLDVPKIGTRLPIYHGTEEAALSAGVGHCDWSSLPVGGRGERCVLTAHSGMQHTRMFDDIRLLEEGDTFVIWALGEPYAYRVCEIETILPEEVERLARVEGRDLCTLVTCTPYGVNSHRLLVTGERCAYVEDEMGETEGVVPYVNRRTTPLLIGIGVLALLLVLLIVRWRLRKRRAAREAAKASEPGSTTEMAPLAADGDDDPDGPDGGGPGAGEDGAGGSDDPDDDGSGGGGLGGPADAGGPGAGGDERDGAADAGGGPSAGDHAAEAGGPNGNGAGGAHDLAAGGPGAGDVATAAGGTAGGSDVARRLALAFDGADARDVADAPLSRTLSEAEFWALREGGATFGHTPLPGACLPLL